MKNDVDFEKMAEEVSVDFPEELLKRDRSWRKKPEWKFDEKSGRISKR